MLTIEKYSFGTGDRFGHQGEAQIRAIVKANQQGIPIVPVWNKSNREHSIVHSSPSDTWAAAKRATEAVKFKGNWYVDADHINLKNVDPFLSHSNFFTIDVADQIGKVPDEREAQRLIKKLEPFTGRLDIPGIAEELLVTPGILRSIVYKFYSAVKEAAAIYRHIAEHRGNQDFIAEVSMDEVEDAQTPVELFFILMMLEHFEVPVQTIAPKFTGRFNKGVDYAGDREIFRKEFEQDLMVIDFVTGSTSLPDNLKLSVHSGSDKFSIYPVIGELIRKHNKGIHVKTAGTTWLEEVIGLALAGGAALEMARTIYERAYTRMEELCGPYATVIDIQKDKLPDPGIVRTWEGEKFAGTLRHIPGNPGYDPMFRQLIHVGYKIASELGTAYTDMLEKHRDIVGKQVTTNLYERHIKRLFF